MRITLLVVLVLLAGCNRSSEPATQSVDGSPAPERPEPPATNIKLPSQIPLYPGAKVESTSAATGAGPMGLGTAYQYEYSTHDDAVKVFDFYHHKLEDSGMKLAMAKRISDGGMVVAEDDAHGQTVNVIVEKGSEGTSIRITTRPKK